MNRKSKRVMVRFEPHIHKKLQHHAAALGVSISELIRSVTVLNIDRLDEAEKAAKEFMDGS